MKPMSRRRPTSAGLLTVAPVILESVAMINVFLPDRVCVRGHMPCGSDKSEAPYE
jgi:hypothetical protein